MCFCNQIINIVLQFMTLHFVWRLDVSYTGLIIIWITYQRNMWVEIGIHYISKLYRPLVKERRFQVYAPRLPVAQVQSPPWAEIKLYWGLVQFHEIYARMYIYRNISLQESRLSISSKFKLQMKHMLCLEQVKQKMDNIGLCVSCVCVCGL